MVCRNSGKKQLEIQKPQWGAVRIHVSSDADFLIPGKQIITENDFIGSTCFYEYYIDADAMHAGKNFGRLCFELPDQSFLYTVTASCKEREEEREISEHREAGQARTELMQLYIDYAAGIYGIYLKIYLKGRYSCVFH